MSSEMKMDWEHTLRIGLYFSLGYLITATMMAIILSGGVNIVAIAKLFLKFDGGIWVGWIFTWMWGWPVWWVSLFIILAWLANIMYFFSLLSETRGKEKKGQQKTRAPRAGQSQAEFEQENKRWQDRFKGDED